jgi:hypothetical protein
MCDEQCKHGVFSKVSAPIIAAADISWAASLHFSAQPNVGVSWAASLHFSAQPTTEHRTRQQFDEPNEP